MAKKWKIENREGLKNWLFKKQLLSLVKHFEKTLRGELTINIKVKDVNGLISEWEYQQEI